MKPTTLTPLLLGLLVSSCGDDGGSTGNPAMLWLAPDMMETRVKLIDHEPTPF